MKRKALGSKGPDISVVGFGAWEAGGDMWGPNPSEGQVVEAIRAGSARRSSLDLPTTTTLPRRPTATRSAQRYAVGSKRLQATR